MAACYRYWSQLVMPHLILLFMFTQFPTAVMHPNSIVCLSSRNTWLGMLDYNCWWNEYRPDVWGQLTSNLLVGLIKFSVESCETLMCDWSELRHLPQHSLFYIRGHGCTSSRPILMGLATCVMQVWPQCSCPMRQVSPYVPKDDLKTVQETPAIATTPHLWIRHLFLWLWVNIQGC